MLQRLDETLKVHLSERISSIVAPAHDDLDSECLTADLVHGQQSSRTQLLDYKVLIELA